MQVEEITESSYKIDLELKEAVLCRIYILGLNAEDVTSIEDLLALLVSYCCDHATDHLQDPAKRLSETEQRINDFANEINS
ncbi:hypothetical protein LCGC14_1189140 [marine sediment metagenome]|uniref:Uncharacterized protein n=1 Tax=marine sediment metagenome TaxID=412755 RepID=A0A0F9M7P2_9ZZZZ